MLVFAVEDPQSFEEAKLIFQVRLLSSNHLVHEPMTLITYLCSYLVASDRDPVPLFSLPIRWIADTTGLKPSTR